VGVPRPADAQEARELIAPYLHALGDQAVGVVTGQALGDPVRPTAPPIPYEGISVLLLPYSAGLEGRLDSLKAHFRDSLRTYMGATENIAGARLAYEGDLLWSGGGQLIRGEVTNAQGAVRLDDVPEGEWLLIAWKEEMRAGKAAKLNPSDAKGFRDIPVTMGYRLLHYWIMRIQVRRGETTTVAFNDRNVWLTGIKEDTYLGQGSPLNKAVQPSQPGKRP